MAIQPKYIFTADDFGPIDFINRGICYAVSRGLINSVQVLANIGRGQLTNALAKLNASVPEGQKIDIGLHLTLTSGKPLYKHTGHSVNASWGKMLKNGKFKKYSQFYFGYPSKFDAIEGEFKAQLERLQEALSRSKADKLELTCLSHHHGIFAIDDVLFADYYSELGNANNLAIRNPKALPASSNNSFFGFVVPLFNLTDRKEDRKEMERMNDAFGKYRFAGKKELRLETPDYTEVAFYGNYGSLTQINVFKKRRIEKRVKVFDEIIDRAKNYPPKPDDSNSKRVVEIVFHIGDHQQSTKGLKQAVKNYNGISHKYFEDRQHELFALETVHNKHQTELKNKIVSWKECDELRFKPL